eukprot:3941043-Rhodomonas_salina.2
MVLRWDSTDVPGFGAVGMSCCYGRRYHKAPLQYFKAVPAQSQKVREKGLFPVLVGAGGFLVVEKGKSVPDTA